MRATRKLSLATVAAAMIGSLFALAGPTAPAYAAGCSDGDRGAAASVAASGQFSVPVPFVYSGSAKVELRYATNGSRCVWGLISNTSYLSKIWIDRSRDGGRTWDGLLGAQYVGSSNSSTYTGLFNDAGVVSRACGFQDTGWWGVDSSGHRYYISRVGTTVCTNWY